ncbi:type II toxin-antitoxin system RelE/ParE family toxin [Pararhizobium sp. DWP3-4]|uniref:type II toxin-antitoxin system RelE/ParE family toxin n=1 Tax=Pararhizobium sp. DWP3-4 TaxID=2804565 RepID=UPI003CF684D0
MQRFPVEYRADAVEDIEYLFSYVLETSFDAVTAARFTDRVFERCEKIGDAPFGGVSRDDLGPGIRVVHFERKAVILYIVRDQTVWITNVFSGRRDYAALLRQTPKE